MRDNGGGAAGRQGGAPDCCMGPRVADVKKGKTSPMCPTPQARKKSCGPKSISRIIEKQMDAYILTDTRRLISKHT